MLAHRFKELLALANQAGKGFASKYLLDPPVCVSQLEAAPLDLDSRSLQNFVDFDCFEV